jgi:L,D-transpeptidase YcbB
MRGFRLEPLFASAAIIALLSAVAAGKLIWPMSGTRDGGTIAPAAATAAAMNSEPAAIQGDEVPAPAVTAATAAAMNNEPAAIQGDEVPAPAVTAATAAAMNNEPAAIQGDEVPAPAVTAPAAATPKPAVMVDGNAAIGEKLRELAGGKFDPIVGGKKERAAFDAFYSSRDYAPLWISDGKPNARARTAIAYLARVEADGLEPADYPVPDFSTLIDPGALAEAEIRLTMSVVTYARHAQLGRVHWSRISGDIFYSQKQPAPTEILGKIAEAGDVGEALDAYEPSAPAYLALKAKLAELRAGKVQFAKAPIPNGPVLKVGMEDGRVPRLRERLGIDGDSVTFDKVVADALEKFQQEHELKPNGLLTQQTIEALNSHQPNRPINTIIANMERWRWMPHDLGGDYVIVNLPDYTLRVFQHDRQIWMTKIVIGAPNMPTPITTAEMKYITVNPTWNVPSSIVTRDSSKIRQCSNAWGSGSAPIRMGRFTFFSRRENTMRWAGCASTSPTSSWSISMTRRTRTCSRLRGGRLATAACGSRIRRNMRKWCYQSCVRAKVIRTIAFSKCSARVKWTFSSLNFYRSISPIRPRFWMRMANLNFAKTSTAATRLCWLF